MRVKNTSIPFFLSLLTFAACGGGGGAKGNVVTPSATLSSLTADRASAPADGTTEVLLTAIVRDTVGATLGSRQVRFEVVGTGAVLDPASATADANGIATSKLTSTVPGPVTVSAVVSPTSDSVRLDTTLTITFTAANAPVVAGPARYEDTDASASANAGDKLVVPFSADVVVNGAVAGDFLLPVQGDSLGTGASVAAGPATNEVTITLGSQPKLRTRGRFQAGLVVANEPSGIDVQNGDGIRSANGGTAASPSQPADIGPLPVAVSSLPVGGQIIAQGDLDGDAFPDVVVSNNGALTPIKNNNGTLTPANAANGPVANAVAIANLNRIGNAEVVTGDAIGVRVWNNTASFGAPPVLQEADLITTGSANGLDVVDFNQDGFPDIITATPAGVIVAVHQRNLGNTYAIGQSLFFPQPTLDVLAVDLDGDGDLDVLAVQAASVQVLRNDGGLLVTDGQINAAGVESLSTGDVDGNGTPEVLLAGQGAATLFTRDGGGAFSGTSLGIAAQKAELVDFDGDSFADVVAVTGNGIEYLLNDRAGAFLPFAVEAAAGLVDLVHFDFDRDGDQDSVALDAGAVRPFAGSLAGTFGDSTLTEGLQLGVDAIGKQELADLNGDGFVDRVVTTANGAQIWFGDGAAGFTVGTTFGQPSPTAIALGDMDNDGDVDAVLGTDVANAANEVYVNDGQGLFSFAWAFSAGTVTRSFGLTDFDQDGDLDVFVGNDGDNQLYTNQPAGGAVQLFLDNQAFLGLLPQALGNETIAVLVFDFDREGDEDIILINGGDITSPQDAYVLRRSGTGYTLLFTLNAQLLATSATLGDVDGDGRNDLAIAQLSPAGNASIKWYRGFATSISTLPTNVATNGQYFSRSIILEDLDGDGRNDFVVGDVSVSNQPIAVLRQQANGSFQIAQEFPTTRLEQIGAGDFDNDGDIDLVTVETTGPSRVLLNR